MAWKAMLLGAKMVTSGVVSTVFASLAAVRAPVIEVKFAATAVVEILAGGVKKRSITWTMPLL